VTTSKNMNFKPKIMGKFKSNLSNIGNGLFLLGMIAYALYVFRYTFFPYQYLKIVFITFGFLGLILNLIGSKLNDKKEFKLLFWLGTLFIFIGLVAKMNFFSGWRIILFVGIGCSAASYFVISAVQTDNSKEDELLDQ
jgi:predicted MFS family arabinose efflux permease